MDIQVEEWLNHPVTTKFFSSLANEKRDLIDIIASGGIIMPTIEATGMEYIRIVNKLAGINMVEDYKAQLQGE